MATDSKTDQIGERLDWVGSLSATPLAEVLRRIAYEERSGDLQIISSDATKSTYFDHGFIVMAASNVKEDRLGESLIQRGRITRQDLAMALMLMKTGKRKLGQALVQAGVMSEEELGRAVALQVNKIVLSLFKVVDGIYSFDERPTTVPMQLMVSLSIYRILLEGIRRMTKGNLILNALPPLDSTLSVSEQPPFTVEFSQLKPVEQAVLRSAGRGATIQSIIDRLEDDRGRVLRACYGLFAAGLLEEGAERRPRRPLKVQEETGVFLLSDLERKFAKIQATNARQEILIAFDSLGEMAEADLLGIDQQKQPPEILEAYEERRKYWAIKRGLVENERSLVMKVDQIQERLDKAYRQIAAQGESSGLSNEAAAEWSSPHARGAEDVPHPAPESAPPPTIQVQDDNDLVPETSEFDTPSSLPPLIAGEEPEEPDFAPAEIEIEVDVEPELGPLLELETDEEESGPTDTRPGLGEPAAPKVRSAEPEIEPSSSQAHETEAESQLPQTEPVREMTSAQRHERIKQLYRDVKLHFQVRDWEGAISLLMELVDLAPNNAAYQGMLAKAMLRHPVMRKNAERHFIAALRLAPQDADLHFWLGMYYKTFNMKSRADTEFRTALRIDPHHQGARKYLTGDGRRKGADPLRDVFRKIFG